MKIPATLMKTRNFDTQNCVLQNFSYNQYKYVWPHIRVLRKHQASKSSSSSLPLATIHQPLVSAPADTISS